MENATKALTMAGGVLIALMIISLVVYMFTQLNQTAAQQEQAKEIEQITQFNLQYEYFNRKDVYGAELISLVNKMQDYNIRESQAKDYEPIDMEIVFTVDTDGVFNSKNKLKKLGSTTEKGTIIYVIDNQATDEEITDLKRKLFKCTGVEYDELNGRIVKMSFEEVNTNQKVIY